MWLDGVQLIDQSYFPKKPWKNSPIVDVVIPALNEEASIALVLRELPDVRNVLVVDNGSTDRTTAVSKENGAVEIWGPHIYGTALVQYY